MNKRMTNKQAEKLLGGSGGFYPNDRDIMSGSVTGCGGYVEKRKKELLKQQEKRNARTED